MAAHRTPTQINTWLDEHLPKLDLPSQYLGDEPNAAGKDWDTAAVRWLLTASWPYEAAAGNQSIPAVYKCINDGRDDFLADRFYLPATPRDLRALERDHIGIFGIESKHPAADFDLVATSISYPVLSMSFIKQLKISGIPIRWRDRNHTHPMIVIGGLAYGAPEFLAPVADCWWLGEAEDEPGNPGIAAFTARIADFKTDGSWTGDRIGCYAALAREFNHLYFPRFIDVHYANTDRGHVGVGPHPSKQVVGYSTNLTGMRLPLRKRHVKDLDAIPALDNPPLLYADPAMGSGDLEVGRGCPAWCSFCALSYRQKPYRQRSVPFVLDYAKQLQNNLGSVRMAPFMPDLPMHTQRRALIAGLLENVSDEVDAPAMRVDDFIVDDQFVLLQVSGGMDSVTLGVEGNSQRMRDLVGKGTADADVRDAVSRGIRAGIRKFKLFMISNLPGEDEGDTYRILTMAKDLADIRESMHQPTVQIQFSWTPLLIEANTPMQWFAPQPASRILGDVWEELRDLKIQFKIGAKAEPNKAAFFQLCQRASRDIGEAIVDTIDEADQACWGGVPRTFADTLARQLRAHGFANDFADCFDERDKADMFGWEFIDQGVSVELMWVTYEQMRDFVATTDSRTYDQSFGNTYHGSEWITRCDQRCYGKTCGTCDHDDLKIRTGYIRAAATDRDIDLAALRPVDQRSHAMRLRARIHRPAKYRYIGNEHWRFTIRRAAFRAQTVLGWQTSIAKRSIRFASDEVHHRDWTAGVDYVEFALTHKLTDTELVCFFTAMNRELDPWLRISDYTPHPRTAVSIRADVDLTLYELDVTADAATIVTRLAAWHGAERVDMRLKIDGGYFSPGSEHVNAKDYVQDLWLNADGHHLTLRMLLRGRPNPYNIYAALLGRPSWLDVAHTRATRLDAFVKTDRSQQDLLRPNCRSCGHQIPTNVLHQPYDLRHCPHCKDRHDGAVYQELSYP